MARALAPAAACRRPAAGRYSGGNIRLRHCGAALKPSDLMLGCAFVNSKLGQEVADDATATATVEAAFACGIRDLDTAPYYGPSEDRVGKALRELSGTAGGEESDMRVVTKVGVIRADDKGGSGTVAELGASSYGARTSFAESIARLGVERLAALRFHDIPDTKGPLDTTDKLIVAAAGVDGMLAGLRALRAEGRIDQVSLGMNASGGPRAEWGSGADVYGTPDQILDLIRAAPNDTFDSVLMASGWNLLFHAGLPVLRECEARNIAVHNAGTFATGLLAGGDTYVYAKAPDEIVSRAQRWKQLAQKFGLELPAVAMAFSHLPACVTKVVIGCSSPEEVRHCVRLLPETAVPAALWKEAQASGLLPTDLLLPCPPSY